ncbi:MAG: hypothetical protein WD274_10135 [Acidimicrobiia bacterium]
MSPRLGRYKLMVGAAIAVAAILIVAAMTGPTLKRTEPRISDGWEGHVSNSSSGVSSVGLSSARPTALPRRQTGTGSRQRTTHPVRMSKTA